MSDTPQLVFGAGGIGDTEKSFTYTWTTPESVSGLLDVLKELDLTILDSAQAYPPTNPWHTDELLGQSEAQKKGFIIDSKTHSRLVGPLNTENVGKGLDRTLKLLGVDKIRIFYIHAPDSPEHAIPYKDIAAAFDAQYKLGKFEQWGISNYDTAQMKELLEACEEGNFNKPTVYQGMYHALYRVYEDDLLPLLRQHNIAFYAFSPLAGGFLTGKVTTARSSGTTLERSRWMGESAMSVYPDLFDHEEVHEMLRKVMKVSEEHGISITESSIRWIMHHSALKGNDALILGASKESQIRSNVAQARQGPLPEAVVKAMEDMWTEMKQFRKTQEMKNFQAGSVPKK